MTRQTIIIIPARYESSRFPGKPLVDIMGQSMIQRVYDRCLLSQLPTYVATDDKRIYDLVVDIGGIAVMTSDEHKNGTSRCLEAVQLLQKQGEDFDKIINVQGDEPFIHLDHIRCIQKGLDDPEVTISSVFTSVSEINSSSVYVVTDEMSNALYFSRSPIPFIREAKPMITSSPYKKHIGTYGYTMAALESYVAMTPTPLEQAESLEQLRWLENGESIRMIESPYDSLCIDRPEDLDQLLNSHFISHEPIIPKTN